ncbi:MAG: hypothetical protein QNJ12_07225 [Ilumatobacter sp.]|uniref:hypothetical protein n=1 Tax=Ilumatobacter sp. TaxID=1967498 RepID=UPI00262870C4|nr:hypothetical protein [Ilumatobacter sp.]MDJ0768569.1 hypothetical protein [Ilumatobacter sp.]
MSVPQLLDRLGTAIGVGAPAATVGVAAPVDAADLPSIVLHAQALERPMNGIGDRPAPSRTGALPVQRSIDLADPVATFLDGSTADLVSTDRLTLFLPFGPAVAADGVEVDTLTGDDISIDIDGTPVTVTSATPGSGEALATPALGTVVFGDPLPSTGLLSVAYSIGEWEVTLDRVRGELVVDVYGANDTSVDDVSRLADAALVPASRGGIAGLVSIAPVEFGEIEPPLATHGNGRRRRLTYAIDAEVELVALGGGGGPIRTVDVTSTFGPELFSVPVP